VNVLKPHLRITVQTLLTAGVSQHEISRRTGVDRKTIRGYGGANSPRVATGSSDANEQIPPPRPPALSTTARPTTPAATASACEPHRAWIETQLDLGRNAQSLYQDLVDNHGFTHRYNSVKRFVARLKARVPERFDVLEFAPGEEAQVDYGQGALTRYRPGQYRRPLLFVMTLKYSGKSFRKTVWKTDQQTWALLHEEAFRALGGCPQYVVLDNLKEGVITPDLYEPALNPVYAELLAHYGVVADPCRVRDPNRKGTVESAIQHTQSTALKGRRFDSLDEQNTFLAHWEARWAVLRIHGRKKRQVLEMYHEEQPHLRPLPPTGFRPFTQGQRTVDDSGLVAVEASYYAALPATPGSLVTVRSYCADIEIRDAAGQVMRRHPKTARKGDFVLDEADRLFNPSRETLRIMRRVEQIGPHCARLAHELFARLGRPGQRALYGLANLTRHYTRADIEAVCAALLAGGCASYSSVKRALKHRTMNGAAAPAVLNQTGTEIREITDYQSFWEHHTQSNPAE
jgi:transposase